MQAFGIREGALRPFKNNSWDSTTPGLFLISDNMELLQLRESFGFDEDTVAQCLTIDDYARFESFESYDFITVNYFYFEGERLIFEEIDLYIGTDYLVLILDNEPLRAELLSFLQKRTQGARRASHNFIYYLIFDFILDKMSQTLETLEDRLEDLEMDILVYAAKEKFHRIIELKAQVNLLKKYIRPLVYLGDAFHMNENHFIRRGNEKYFSGVGTRFKKLYDFSASLGDLVAQVQNSYDSAVSMRESETSEKLTLLAGMVAPLTVITGIYGMNFTFMPELNWRWSYPVVLAAMIAIEIFFYYRFRKRKK
ncbi:MAG TPA: magnesium transporter CorA family protein [Candidatus Fimivicinus intestinavium]|nr:magnesium transporter CorA family protein [Candidatus Fimivicinus intestinavium]